MPEETIPTPETPAPAQPVEISCPNCNASLRNISVEPGAAIRCLNCGKRFTANTADAAPLAETAREPGLASGKEPASAGYWLMRIPAMLVLLLSIAGYLFSVVMVVGTSRRGGDFYWQMIYLPLWPAAAAMLFLISRAMARIEAHCIAVAWREEKLRDAPAPLPDSSLPYIGPLAIGGGLLPIVALTGSPDLIVVLPSLFGGGMMLYAGFMLEDARQFIWRQGCLARAFSGKPRAELLTVTSALWPACAFGSLSLAALFLLSESRGAALPVVYSTLLFAGLACTSYLLGLNWDRTVLDWRLAGRGNLWSIAEWTAVMTTMVAVPVAWAIVFVLFVLWLLTSQNVGSGEGLVFFGVLGFGASVPAAAAGLLLQFYRWRATQCRVLNRYEINPSQAVPWFNYFSAAVIALVALESISAFVTVYGDLIRRPWSSSQRFSQFVVALLAITAFTYIPLWLLAVTREFLLVEALWAQRCTTQSHEEGP